MCILQDKRHLQDSCKSLKDERSTRTKDWCIGIHFKSKIICVALIVRVDKGVFLKDYTTNYSICLYVGLLSVRLTSADFAFVALDIYTKIEAVLKK